MGRKRKRNIEHTEEVELESPTKKKTKHKKKKTKKEQEDDPPTVKPLTLKIRLGNEVVTADTADVMSLGNEDSLNAGADVSSNSIKSGSAMGLLKQNSEDWGGSDDILSVGEDSYQNTLPGDVTGETDDLEESGVMLDEDVLEGGDQDEEEEEEVWLEALETGNVDERGYVPQKKDPAAMTARQRAIYGSNEVELVELPLGKKRVAVDEEETQEMLLKKTERNKKRRLQAIKRREKHKAETVQKLLQKQTRKKEDKKFDKTVAGPHLRYVSGCNGVTVSLTEGLQYPILPATNKSLSLPPPVSCTICSSPKKYSDSATKLPLCSLECFKKLKQQQQSEPISC